MSLLWVSKINSQFHNEFYDLLFCSNVSTTIDPFRDISLDLAPRGKLGICMCPFCLCTGACVLLGVTNTCMPILYFT